METSKQDAAKLEAAGYAYEYPGFWGKEMHGLYATISDGVGMNGGHWEVQISTADGSEFVDGIGGNPDVETAIEIAGNLCEAHSGIAFWQSQGFTIYETGGNCTAFRKEFDNGAYLLVTAQEDARIPVFTSEPVTVGAYNSDDEQVNTFGAKSSRAAAAHLRKSGVIK